MWGLPAGQNMLLWGEKWHSISCKVARNCASSPSRMPGGEKASIITARGRGLACHLGKVMNMPAKLTAKQQLFVAEYLKDLNATQAAIRAGYSEKTAFSIGAENLSKPLIQEALQKAMKKRSERTEVSVDLVVNELLKIATDEAGDETNSHLKYSNKMKALELLGKHLGMFSEKIQVEMPEGGVVMLPPRKDE